MPKTALALRQFHFEDLGPFCKPLEYARYEIAYSNLTDYDFCQTGSLEPYLMVILGVPIGVYETDASRSSGERLRSSRLVWSQ